MIVLDLSPFWVTVLSVSLPLGLALVFHRWVLRIIGVVVIPENAIGIVEKAFVIFGKHRTLPDGKLIALWGEAGVQADTLAPGLHLGLWPWQYRVRREDFVSIGEDELGVIEARDGSPLGGSDGRVLGRSVLCDSFQSARAFLANGGERGPQIAILPPGTYRINTQLFDVTRVPVTIIPTGKVAVVTTREGTSLPTGEIAGREVTDHKSFQDGQAFVDAGGFRGLQEQVMLAGRYFLNPRFVSVELVPMTEVPIAHVGVVIAYVGAAGVDVTGDAFKHGNLVSKGQKGVWADPLDPGRYAINPMTHKVEIVPTANVVLNWANDKSESHKLDEKLCTITVRSSDGFTFNLDVSQIIHVPRGDAPRVIARFGSMPNLVTQVLEPTIGNYFRNAAQQSDVIDFLKKRTERQADAKAQIGAALAEYNVGAVDTLIGDIVPPEQLMKTLTDRKLAEQEKVTYETQRLAETQRQTLQQARALADTQATVVDAERSVSIAEFAAQAAVKRATGEADAKKLNAQADAEVTRVTGVADAGKILAVGSAEAEATKLRIASVEPKNYAAIEVARALSGSGQQLVPQVVMGGGAGSPASSLVEVLVAMMLRENAQSTSEAQ